MRGKALHNLMVNRTNESLTDFCDIDIEHKLFFNGITNYVDLYIRYGLFELAIEVETTVRHAVDNAKKAAVIGVPLWIVVPTRRLKSTLTKKLNASGLRPGNEPIKVLLLDALRQALMKYLSRRIDGRIEDKQIVNRQNTPTIGSKFSYEN
jgi:hypothetical protein